MKVRRSILTSIISPWIGIIFSTLSGNKKSIAFYFALISVLFVPIETNDKYYYQTLYLDFYNQGVDELIYLLGFKLDFIFYPLLFFGSKFKIPFELINFIFSYGTLYFLFSFLEQFVSPKNLRKGFVLILITLSFADFFSGIRFYLALSLLLFSLIYPGLLKRLGIGLIAVLVHPGIAIHFMTFSIFFNRKNSELPLKLILFLALLVGLVGMEVFISALMTALPINELIENKLTGYFLEQSKTIRELSEGNLNFKLFFYYRIAIIFFMCHHGIILFMKKKFSRFDSLSIISLSISFLTLFIPEVFLRYSLLYIPFYIIVILSPKKLIAKQLFSLYCYVYFTLQVIVYSYQIIGEFGIKTLTFNLFNE
ncbi:MAG: EpsG family protein [Flavobacteriaceae bacterium]|nr:EpsG family protein [Flavobacteriaceae bacterium]